MNPSNTNKPEVYQDEVEQRWGETAAYAEYTGKHSQEINDSVIEGMESILHEFSLCMKSEEKPDSTNAQALVKSLQSYISKHFYTCTNQIFAGLGQMYVVDERFKHNIDKHADGTAQFISSAISIYCDKTTSLGGA